MKLVTKIKLIVCHDQADALHQEMFADSEAFNFVRQYAFRTRVFNNFSLHHALYSTIRLKFRLPAQLAVSVLSKVVDAYKTELAKAARDKRDSTLCRFKKHLAIARDARILTYGNDHVCMLPRTSAIGLPPISLLRRVWLDSHFYCKLHPFWVR